MTYKQIFWRTLAAVVAMLLTMPVMVWADVTINNVTFPDENFRNWVLEQDFGSDGVLTDQEIESVTSIDVDGKGITYLVGIEYFTNLQQLRCERNHLKTLSLRKNTQLTLLDCKFNLIEYVDVTQNSLLEILRVSDNRLADIQLPENAPLKRLEMDHNSIRGESMDAVVAQLPEVSPDYYNRHEITAARESSDYPEQNIMTKAQVDAAKAKGWDVYIRSFDKYNFINPYQGQEPAFYAINAHRESAHGYAFCDVNTSVPYELVEFIVGAYEGYQPIISITSGSVEGSIEFTHVNNEIYAFRMPLGDVSISADFGWFINESHFPDEIFRNFLLDTNQGADALLTDAEIASLTHIDVDEMSISSLAGIERLTPLQFLSCDMNNLNSLDVSSLTNLHTLICTHNNLTALDLSNNLSLTLLECSSNQIVGENMELLVSSLPTVEEGELHILSLTDHNERNEITTEQVEIAKAKGWKVCAQTAEGWQDFDEVVTGINNLKSSHPTNASKYNLKGQLVGDDYKGIVIEDDKKIVVR